MELCFIICFVSHTSMAHHHLIGLMLWCTLCMKRQKHEPVNYRSVSLTNIHCKITEHCTATNIWPHLNKHSIITSKQHGLRRGISCKTQLIEAMYDWTNILNKGKGQIYVILLDFSKAFGIVPHHRLITKLYIYISTGVVNG